MLGHSGSGVAKMGSAPLWRWILNALDDEGISLQKCGGGSFRTCESSVAGALLFSVW